MVKLLLLALVQCVRDPQVLSQSPPHLLSRSQAQAGHPHCTESVHLHLHSLGQLWQGTGQVLALPHGLLQGLNQGYLQMQAGHLHSNNPHLPSLLQASPCPCLTPGHPQLFSTAWPHLLRLDCHICMPGQHRMWGLGHPHRLMMNDHIPSQQFIRGHPHRFKLM